MTRAACEFVAPLTFQALSGHPVYIELLDHDTEAGMGHITLARWADIIAVAPASANLLARIAHGIADDLLTTICLASDAPLLLAPAMNRQMWSNPATAANVQTVLDRGVILLGPAEGDQACGETGPGRMLEPAGIVQGIEARFRTGRLSGARVLVTAGPTREAIDPVRYISNHSSGRMGYAVARAAVDAGAGVTLISGPVAIPAPENVRCITVQTAGQMHAEVLRLLQETDIFISAAAVADYRCSRAAGQKIKKSGQKMSLELEKNPDILAAVTAVENAPFVVGFAAETESVRDNAMKKLRKKKMDLVAANQVGNGLGFDTEDNALDILWEGGGVSLEKMPKGKLARHLIEIVADRYHAKNPD